MQRLALKAYSDSTKTLKFHYWLHSEEYGLNLKTEENSGL